MECFPPLRGFYAAIDDAGISVMHIGIFIALLQQWNINGGNNSVTTGRAGIMNAAKTTALYTYTKCMN